MEFELEESAFTVAWDVGTSARFEERKLTTPGVLRNSSGKSLVEEGFCDKHFLSGLFVTGIFQEYFLIVPVTRISTN